MVMIRAVSPPFVGRESAYSLCVNRNERSIVVDFKGAKTFAAHLNAKQIATNNCCDGGACTRYVIEMQTGSKFYDLNVTQESYEKAQINTCYSVTYYPS